MKRLVGAAPALLLALLLVGCVRHRWLEVEPGEYTQVHGTDEASRAVARHIRGLSVDRDAETVTFTLDDGSKIPLTFTARERPEWPGGCPTNIILHHMEVLEVEESNLSIASMTFQEPILVRSCPSEPREIVLREERSAGGTGSACRDSCLVFGQAGSSDPTLEQEGAPPSSLPHSEKGYELYSWTEREGGPWHYTLVTGTNRQKTSEELTTGEDMLTEDGWVKLSVTGTAALLQLLERLPAGEQVFWHSAVPAPAGAEGGQFRLPGQAAVTAVEARCRELELQLTVVTDELQAVLAIPEAVSSGKVVTLTFTLINHANYPLYVLKWYTPLEGIAGEIFHVTRDGRPLPYEGILAMRGDPSPENYVLLQPGESETATVDLAQAYDFSEAGAYTVTFLSPRISHVARSEAEMARTVDDLGPVTIVSNSVRVTVSTGE